MFMHILFLVLLYQSVTEKRRLRDAYALTESLQTIFIDEEFGDFNEKSFMDVRNFEEVWDWTKDVLVPGAWPLSIEHWPPRLALAAPPCNGRALI